MPRPNPPRRRPRRRPDAAARAARAEADLARQTADIQKPGRSEEEPPRRKAAAATAIAAPPPDEMWQRRSYAILVGLVALFQVLLNIVLWATGPADHPPLLLYVLTFSFPLPLSTIAACLIAAPVAKRLTGERRTLRFVESIFVGIIAFFLWTTLLLGLITVLNAVNPAPASSARSCATSGAVPTPVPAGASAAASTATPCPSPSASASHETAPASASPTPSATNNTVNALSTTAGSYVELGVIDAIAFVLTIYLYPPLYKRMRMRPPPPRKSRDGGKAKS